MYLQKVKFLVDILKVTDENSRIPLFRGMDPRIGIHTKISWIRNTALKSMDPHHVKLLRLEVDCYDAFRNL